MTLSKKQTTRGRLTADDDDDDCDVVQLISSMLCHITVDLLAISFVLWCAIYCQLSICMIFVYRNNIR